MSVAVQALIEALQEALTLFELQKVHAGKLEQAASYSRMAKELSDSLNPGFSMAQRMIRQSSFFSQSLKFLFYRKVYASAFGMNTLSVMPTML